MADPVRRLRAWRYRPPGFLDRAARFALGGPTAAGILAVLSLDFAIAHALATQVPELATAVPFCGNHPPGEDAAKVKLPLLIHFAAVDERINAAWPAHEATLKAAGAKHTGHPYAGTCTASTTTPRRVSMRRPPSCRGSAPWPSSRSACAAGAASHGFAFNRTTAL